MLRLRPQPLREPKFVLECHFWAGLRVICACLVSDTLYADCATMQLVRNFSAQQGRTLLTRNSGVLKHSVVTRGYWLRETDSRRQAEEVVRRLDLGPVVLPPLTTLHGLQWTAHYGLQG